MKISMISCSSSYLDMSSWRHSYHNMREREGGGRKIAPPNPTRLIKAKPFASPPQRRLNIHCQLLDFCTSSRSIYYQHSRNPAPTMSLVLFQVGITGADSSSYPWTLQFSVQEALPPRSRQRGSLPSQLLCTHRIWALCHRQLSFALSSFLISPHLWLYLAQSIHSLRICWRKSKETKQDKRGGSTESPRWTLAVGYQLRLIRDEH